MPCFSSSGEKSVLSKRGKVRRGCSIITKSSSSSSCRWCGFLEDSSRATMRKSRECKASSSFPKLPKLPDRFKDVVDSMSVGSVPIARSSGQTPNRRKRCLSLDTGVDVHTMLEEKQDLEHCERILGLRGNSHSSVPLKEFDERNKKVYVDMLVRRGLNKEMAKNMWKMLVARHGKEQKRARSHLFVPPVERSSAAQSPLLDHAPPTLFTRNQNWQSSAQRDPREAAEDCWPCLPKRRRDSSENASGGKVIKKRVFTIRSAGSGDLSPPYGRPGTNSSKTLSEQEVECMYEDEASRDVRIVLIVNDSNKLGNSTSELIFQRSKQQILPLRHLTSKSVSGYDIIRKALPLGDFCWVVREEAAEQSQLTASPRLVFGDKVLPFLVKRVTVSNLVSSSPDKNIFEQVKRMYLARKAFQDCFLLVEFGAITHSQPPLEVPPATEESESDGLSYTHECLHSLYLDLILSPLLHDHITPIQSTDVDSTALLLKCFTALIGRRALSLGEMPAFSDVVHRCFQVTLTPREEALLPKLYKRDTAIEKSPGGESGDVIMKDEGGVFGDECDSSSASSPASRWSSVLLHTHHSGGNVDITHGTYYAAEEGIFVTTIAGDLVVRTLMAIHYEVYQQLVAAEGKGDGSGSAPSTRDVATLAVAKFHQHLFRPFGAVKKQILLTLDMYAGLLKRKQKEDEVTDID